MKENGLMMMCVVAFFVFSMINLYNYDFFFVKQIIWYIAGFIIFFITSKLSNKTIIRISYLLYIILNIMLIYLLIFGTSTNGSKAWLNIGFFSFQPSEFMKVVLIIILSYISYKKYYVIKSFILTLIPAILTFLEPETGNVIFYFLILLSILFFRSKSNNFLKITFSFSIFITSVLFSLYYFYNNLFISIFGSNIFYRIDRVVGFLNSNYQLDQSLIAIGTSHLFGGKTGAFIPEAKTDFAFSLLISKIGFIGICGYLLINFIFNMLVLKKTSRQSGVMKLITLSFISLKIFQESIAYLMNIGLFPITGITLPFISYGGSSIISYFFILGIISNSNKDYNLDRVEVYNKPV